MDVELNTFFLNPARRSPWESTAPSGINQRRLQRVPSMGISRHERASMSRFPPGPGVRMQAGQRLPPRYQMYFREHNLLFKSLNKKTLILAFPHVHPKEIDVALSLCNNNLSETMKLIQLRERVGKYKCDQNKNSTTPKVVKYIPTKYSDVQIVETVSTTNSENTKIMEVNHDILKLLQTCNTDIKREKREDTITLYSADSYPSSDSMLSPANSTVSSNDSNKFAKIHPDIPASITVRKSSEIALNLSSSNT